MNTPSTHSPAPDAELRALLIELTEQGPTVATSQKLKTLLHHADDATLDLYLDYIALHANLSRTFCPVAAPSKPLPIYRKGYEPQPFKLRPHHFAVAAAALLIAGLAVGLYSAVAYYQHQVELEKEQAAIAAARDAQPVATLIQRTGNLTTPSGYPSDGRDYPRGEYALSSGSAEFMLTNAVNVKLRGNTRMHMRNDMNVALTRGSASFVVPKDAKGFTVRLPDQTRVIDLGTAFRVEIDEAGRSMVHVTEGEVEWRSSDAEGVRIVAGRTARINETGAIAIEPIEVNTTVFNARTNRVEDGDDAPGHVVEFASSRLTKTVDVAAAFGASGGRETGVLLFASGGVADNGNDVIGDAGETVDHVAWRTDRPVTLSGYQITLGRDRTSDGGLAPRSTQMIRFSVDGGAVDTFDVDGEGGVMRRVFLGGPATGSRFRIELTRSTNGPGNAGPRVIEIDAINAIVHDAASKPDTPQHAEDDENRNPPITQQGATR